MPPPPHLSPPPPPCPTPLQHRVGRQSWSVTIFPRPPMTRYKRTFKLSRVQDALLDGRDRAVVRRGRVRGSCWGCGQRSSLTGPSDLHNGRDLTWMACRKYKRAGLSTSAMITSDFLGMPWGWS